jgi:putative endonuclease
MKEGLIVYILECSDNSYYVGITNQLHRRLNEHNEGEDITAYTYNRRPVCVVWSNTFASCNEAIIWEKKLKKWTRKKKEALINGDFKGLHRLAICKNETHYSNHASTTLSMTG